MFHDPAGRIVMGISLDFAESSEPEFDTLHLGVPQLSPPRSSVPSPELKFKYLTNNFTTSPKPDAGGGVSPETDRNGKETPNDFNRPTGNGEKSLSTNQKCIKVLTTNSARIVSDPSHPDA
jgi:hypothetical protein